MTDEAPGLVYVILTDDDKVKYLAHVDHKDPMLVHKAAIEAGYREGTFKVLPMEYLKFPR